MAAFAMAIVSHSAPVPPGFEPKWRDLLEKHVALYRRIPEDLTLCTEELMPWFLKKVKWEWKPWVGLFPDKEMQKVCVAFQACFLIVCRSKQDYAHFHTFRFHPCSLVDKNGETWAGWATHSGMIEQSWPSTLRGMEDGSDNHNTTIHEFAHIIDCRNSSFDSIPHFDDSNLKREFTAFMETEYRDICRAWKRMTGDEVIRKYATTDEAEFFTCATEAFFERSEMLKFMRPQLYEWMQKIYHMDSAEWPERLSLTELQQLRSRNSNWTRYRLWNQATLPEWTCPAKEYLHHRMDEERRRLEEERELKRKREEERLRLEKLRLARLTAEEAKRRRRELERLERRKRERDMLNNRTVIVEHPNGQPELKYTLVNGRREGMLQRWDENGVLREEAEFEKGRKQGPVTYFHSNGTKEIDGFFRMNERAGVWRGWHEDGTPSFRSEYREGKLHTWEQFNEDGQSRTFGRVNRFGRR